jgi:hypothetical protein
LLSIERQRGEPQAAVPASAPADPGVPGTPQPPGHQIASR